jgi:O-antigen ligase
LSVFVITGMLYFTSAPLLARIAVWRAESAVVIESPALTHHLQKAVERGDNGRFDIYRAGWNALDNPWLGTGQWGVRDVWQCELQPDPCSMMTHLHSAFFATFVHGGIIGAVLLLALLLQALRSARDLAQKGDATWIALLAFGSGGLLFDGESLTSLATAPRFEGLLFWLPVVVVLARGGLTSRPRAA